MSDLFGRVEKIRELMVKIIPRIQMQFLVPKKAVFEMHMTIPQIKTLILFEHKNKYKMSEIAKALGAPLPTMTHVVDTLVKQGYLKRSFDEKDRRVVYIEITKKGKNVIKEAIEFHRARIKELLMFIDESDQKKLSKIIDEFKSVLEGIGKKMTNKIKKGVLMAGAAVLCFSYPCAAEELTLEKSIEYAMAHNQKILIAKEKIKAAEGSLMSANALLLPSVSATGSYTRSSYLSNLSFGDSVQLPVLGADGLPTGEYIPYPSFSFSSDRVGDLLSGRISLQYLVFSWGKLEANYDIALYNKIINEYDYDRIVSEAVFEIKSSYYAILLGRELVNVIQETKKSLEAHLKVVDERFKVGLASNYEVLRAQVQLANIEPQLTRAENQLELSVMNFNANLGSETNDKFTASGELQYEKKDFIVEKCIEDALKQRAEIRQMDLREKITEASKIIAVSGYRPNVILTAGYQTNRGGQLPPNDMIWQSGWDAGVVLSIPIFDGFNASGKYQEAEANRKQVDLSKSQLLKYIDLEVKSSYLTLKSSEKTISSQLENVKVAKKSLDIITERYKEGVAANLEVLDTEVSVLQARINYLQALYEYNIAKERLIKSMGMTGGK